MSEQVTDVKLYAQQESILRELEVIRATLARMSGDDPGPTTVDMSTASSQADISEEGAWQVVICNGVSIGWVYVKPAVCGP